MAWQCGFHERNLSTHTPKNLAVSLNNIELPSICKSGTVCKGLWRDWNSSAWVLLAFTLYQSLFEKHSISETAENLNSNRYTKSTSFNSNSISYKKYRIENKHVLVRAIFKAGLIF